ncbi:MAG: twin-arginine translocase TatA/TatE family subunit [Candidatus Omnitrophica bacterium]|jgi:sec-independent protein translocase protein TatA|nr:twin-arginine translocase TatA/TatE family subunit [Candidatus Omnitrophota bacterium]
MFGIGWSEILVFILIALLFAGAERLPEIGRSLGEAIREIRNLKRKKRS